MQTMTLWYQEILKKTSINFNKRGTEPGCPVICTPDTSPSKPEQHWSLYMSQLQ